MKYILAIFMLASVTIFGCTKIDPPCRPGDLDATQAEADANLERMARKETAAGRGGEEGSRWNCGAPNWRKWDIGIPFRRILDCVEQTIPISQGMGISMTLTECMWSVARMEYARAVLKIPDDKQVEQLSLRQQKQIMDLAHAAVCLEQFRNVEVNADKHNLNRTGPTEWVPAVLWLLIQSADKAMAPATGGFMFLIKPGPGVEEACVEPLADAPKKCADQSGCDGVPAGAEKIDGGGASGTGGDVIPPGTDPTGGAGTGDYP